jgi:hypothetical protein
MVAAVLKRGRAGAAREDRFLGRASLEEPAVLREGRNMNIVCGGGGANAMVVERRRRRRREGRRGGEWSGEERRKEEKKTKENKKNKKQGTGNFLFFFGNCRIRHFPIWE